MKNKLEKLLTKNNKLLTKLLKELEYNKLKSMTDEELIRYFKLK